MNTVFTKRSAHRDDGLLLLGQTLSQVSDRMVQLGLIWFITSHFGETFLIWYLVVGGLPHALLVKYSSQIIEKLSALKTVLYSDFARGVIYALAFACLTIFPEWTSAAGGDSVLWLLYISVFAGGIFGAFFNPAIMSLSVEIKESDQIQKLTAKLSSITSFATIIGPVLGLFIFNRFGLSGLFIISSICYFISTYSLSLVTKAERPNKDSPATAIEWVPFRLFKTQAIIGTMLTVFLFMNFLLSPLQVLMPAMAKNIFGNSFNSLALLETVLGFGILMGGAVLSFFSIERRTLFWSWIFTVAISVAFLFFTSSMLIPDWEFQWHGDYYKMSFFLAATSLLILGLCLGIANVLIINILQTQPNPQHVPKVMSLVNLISTATLPFSLAILGLLQRQFSISVLSLAASCLLVLVSAFSFFPFRRFGGEIFQ